MKDYKKFFEANKQLWDARVQPHLGSKMYDMEGFRNGRSSLTEIETNTLGSVVGKDILHLQCHFGQDSLSFSRQGAAKVVGIDISEKAITTAKVLANELGLNTQFECSNVYDIGKLGEFDIVFSTYGAIPWLPDLQQWASIINQNLKPGGLFYFCEFHPSLYVLDFDTKEMMYDYFNTEEPITEIAEGTYADANADIKMEEYSWNHGASEIITPLLNEGLQLIKFAEYDWSPYDCFPNMLNVGEGKYRIDLGIRFPHLLEMVFRKPQNTVRKA